MSSSSITSKGQVTIPSALREKFQLQPGDKVLFEERDGLITLSPLNQDIEAMAGCLSEETNGRTASLEDMDKAIKDEATASWQDSERDNNAGH